MRRINAVNCRGKMFVPLWCCNFNKFHPWFQPCFLNAVPKCIWMTSFICAFNNTITFLNIPFKWGHELLWWSFHSHQSMQHQEIWCRYRGEKPFFLYIDHPHCSYYSSSMCLLWLHIKTKIFSKVSVCLPSRVYIMSFAAEGEDH